MYLFCLKEYVKDYNIVGGRRTKMDKMSQETHLKVVCRHVEKNMLQSEFKMLVRNSQKAAVGSGRLPEGSDFL